MTFLKQLAARHRILKYVLEMKLIEALEIIRRKQRVEAQAFRVGLVCGFTPLHIQTFLNAHLQLVLPESRVEVSPGLYGDFWGNLGSLERADYDAFAVVMEWSDLDPRLGFRSLGSWAPSALADILGNARARAAQFEETIQRVSRKIPLTICFPTLPLPPISFCPSWQASRFDIELRACVSAMSLAAAQLANVRIVNPQRLDQLSPLASRLDVKAELVSGFPYKLSHASTVAELMSLMIQRPSPKKGLITDLDDTLWNGILGELGVEGVSWDLEHHSQMHGVYQRLIHSLSEAGVLVGVASKNDPKLVGEALARSDLLLPQDALFPVEAHWGAKSGSVTHILKVWNIGANSVVFIDDSPMELAEVKATHPDVECILYPKDDPQAVDELLRGLRDLFGKATLSEEDAIRRESIRQATIYETNEGRDNDTARDFLKHADAEITINFSKNPLDPRALELVNKTNQFNLNGIRHTETSWQEYFNQPETFLLIASYRDKYGPLGKIAVLAGQKVDQVLHVNVWVMSCRAFSRRIEHRCLQELFERYNVEAIEFNYESTLKNAPLGEFLAEMLDESPTQQCRLSRDSFFKRWTETFHRVMEISNG